MDLLELVSQNTNLRRVASTDGGEYAGPCPFCGGKDRFRVWPAAERPHFWCRGCNKRGDAIQYLCERDSLSFQEAKAAIQILFAEALPGQETPAAEWAGQHVTPACPFSDDGSPSQEWQTQARKLSLLAFRTLWSPEGKVALDYLRGRGLHDDTIRKALLGYVPSPSYDAACDWGLASDEKAIWLPAGILIPWIIHKSIWGIRMRSIEPCATYRYVHIRGSHNALYRADTLRADVPAMLVEGEFDALSIVQHASDKLAVVATGSTHGARNPRWLERIAQTQAVLISFDADEAGDKAADWWLERLFKVNRWHPCWEDGNALLQDGFALETWVEMGIKQSHRISFYL